MNFDKEKLFEFLRKEILEYYRYIRAQENEFKDS